MTTVLLSGCYTEADRQLESGGSITWETDPIWFLAVNDDYAFDFLETDLLTLVQYEVSDAGYARRELFNKRVLPYYGLNRIIYDADDPASWIFDDVWELGGGCCYKKGATDALSVPIFFVKQSPAITTEAGKRHQFHFHPNGVNWESL